MAGSPSSRSSRPSSTTPCAATQPQIKDLIKQLDTFIGGLDAQKSEIVRAIDNIDKLAGKLAAQKDDIAKAVEALPGGLKVLADQRQQLVQLLQALSRLGAVGTQVIQQSKADTAANLKALEPILAQLTKAGDNLPKSLQLLLTYPFSDSTVGAMKGDYTNMSIDLDLNLEHLAGNLGRAHRRSRAAAPPTPGGSSTSGPLIPGCPCRRSPSRACRSLPAERPRRRASASPGHLCRCPGPARSGSADESWRSLYGGAA